MPKTLADLWEQTISAFDSQDWDPALRRCIVILQGVPRNFEARMKVADILLKQGRVDEAVKIY